MRVAMRSMSRPPAKKETTAPMKPETDSRPMLWMLQFQGGAVKVCEATSWTAMLLARTIPCQRVFPGLPSKKHVTLQVEWSTSNDGE